MRRIITTSAKNHNGVRRDIKKAHKGYQMSDIFTNLEYIKKDIRWKHKERYFFITNIWKLWSKIFYAILSSLRNIPKFNQYFRTSIELRVWYTLYKSRTKFFDDDNGFIVIAHMYRYLNRGILEILLHRRQIKLPCK